MLKIFKSAVMVILCAALTGCAGSRLYTAIVLGGGPDAWLKEASQQPWLSQRIPPAPITAAEAVNVEAAALQQNPVDVLWVTLSQSPNAQKAREVTAQMEGGAEMYEMQAPEYAILLIAARRGDPQAQAYLGDFYAREDLSGAYRDDPSTGHPHFSLIPVLRQAAVVWIKKAATQGVNDGPCDFDLALMYQSTYTLQYNGNAYGYGGYGAPRQSPYREQTVTPSRQDIARALYWYKQAVARGYAPAETNLGDIYRHGAPGMAVNTVKAFRLYRKAAVQGQPYAEYRMAVAYRYGLGTARVRERATIWLNRAVAAQWPAALDLYEHILLKPVVAIAQTGNATVQYQLALAYYNGSYHGRSIPKNYVKAAYWFKQCAPAGKDKAEFYMGYCYASGLGVAVNYRKAAYWFGLAAKQGNASAENNIGVMFARGQYYTQNYLQAARWYNVAANHGSALAAENLRELLSAEAARQPNNQQLQQQLLGLGIGIQAVEQFKLQQQRAAQQQSAENIAAQAAQNDADEAQEEMDNAPDPGGD